MFARDPITQDFIQATESMREVFNSPVLPPPVPPAPDPFAGLDLESMKALAKSQPAAQ
jgi:hypothetical protein